MNTALTNHLKIAILLLTPGVAVGLLGYGVAGWPGAGALATIYGIFAIAAVFSAQRMVLRQHAARYISEREAPGLYGLMRELAQRAGIEVPAVYLIPESAAQLLVTGASVTRSAVFISRGLLHALTREELGAVMAHAVSRIRTGAVVPMTIAAGMVEAIISFSNYFRWSHLLPSTFVESEKRAGIPSDAFLWPLFAPVAAALIRVSTFASRQVLEDEASAYLLGDARPLAEALWNIEAYVAVAPLESASPATAHLFICNPLSGDGWVKLFHTHPPIGDRLKQLEALGRRSVGAGTWYGARQASQCK